MLKVTIHELNGDILFAGMVPEKAVTIRHGIGRPSTATISMPLTDLLSQLSEKKCSCEVPGALQSLATFGNTTSCMLCHRVIT